MKRRRFQSTPILARVAAVAAFATAIAGCGVNDEAERQAAAQRYFDETAPPVWRLPVGPQVGEYEIENAARYKGLPGLTVVDIGMQRKYQGSIPQHTLDYRWAPQYKAHFVRGLLEGIPQVVIGRYIADKVGPAQQDNFTGTYVSVNTHYEPNDLGKALEERKIIGPPYTHDDVKVPMHKDASGHWTSP